MSKKNDDLVRAEFMNIVKGEQDADLFKRKLQEIVRIPMPLSVKKKLSEQGVSIQNGTLMDVMSASLVLQAMNGNIAAYTIIRDTMGYKPVDQVKNDVNIEVKLAPGIRELGE